MKTFLSSFLIKQRLCSSRASKSFIKNHTVTVNGNLVKDKTFLIDDTTDTVVVDDTQIQNERYVYIMLNKPLGTVCSTVSDKSKTIYSLFDKAFLESIPHGLHSVGRLDKDTCGLLILTNNGKLANEIINPESNIQKTYYVKLKNSVSAIEQVEYSKRCGDGVTLPADKKAPEYKAKPCDLQWENENSCFLTICEGKFHQVRRTFLALGNEVIFLERKSIGSLFLDESLKRGEYRELTTEEMRSITNIA